MNNWLILYLIFCLSGITAVLILEIIFPSDNTIEFFNNKVTLIRKLLNKVTKHFK